MAGSATVGSLRVMLGLDSAQFTAGLTKAQMGLQRFAGIAKQGALAIGTAMITAGGAVAVAMKGIIDEADKLSKMSQAIGVPIEQLSRLKYAAQLADIDLDTLGKSLKRLSAGMMDASEKGTGPAARAFAMLGIQVRDAAGDMRPATGVIEDLAGKFARMPDGVEKTALAMRIFGKAGADMIPLLNEGSAGLAEMYKEAEELGIVLDEETGRAAEAFNDNLTRLGVVKDGIITKITTGMLPALESLTEALVLTARNSAALNAVGGALGWTLRFIATSAVTASGFFRALAHDIKTTAQVAYLWATGQYAAAVAVADNGDVVRARTLDGIEATNRAIWARAPGRPPAAAALEDVELAGDRATRSANRLSAAQRDANRAAEELARDGAQTFEQTRTPLEQYTAQVENLNRQLAAAAISQDTFNRAMTQARDNFNSDDPLTRAGNQFRDDLREKRERDREDRIKLAADHEEDLRDATFNGIRDGLHAAADGNLGQYLAARLREKLFDGLADALTNLLRGAKGGSGGAIGWLKAAGSMFSTVAGSMKLPGFKTGGSFRVGGSGGIDSQMMAFRATPGEMVDIRRPGQDMGGGALAVHVSPSPYFDVQVERVATPVAQAAAGHMGRQVLDASRRAAPALQNRQRLLGTT